MSIDPEARKDATMAGLIGGAVTLVMGCYGLYKLKCNGPTQEKEVGLTTS